ncbi:MAG: hydroxyacylglutathione hydrolase [Bdellovibrionales bacterium]|nr:hydroxyacylglutathione hydrolase [Bdellovibrionales bacterium]
MALKVIQFLVLDDNYNYLLVDEDTGKSAVVDPSVALPTMRVLQENDVKLDYIFHTHHHYDHVDGNPPLLKTFPDVKVVGPKDPENRFPNISIELDEGEVFELGNTKFELMVLPGHTISHCAYYSKENKVVFCGDVLFSLGCGKIFEGSYETMYNSLQRIAGLPDDTQIYCAHEYTIDNAAFAMTVEPDNPELHARLAQAEELQDQGIPTVPSLVGEEKKANPFLRCFSDEIRTRLDAKDATDVEIFEKLRRKKDNFKA